MAIIGIVFGLIILAFIAAVIYGACYLLWMILTAIFD